MEGAGASEGGGSGSASPEPEEGAAAAVEFHEDEEIIEVLELNEGEADPDDVASDVVDVDFAEEPEDGEMGDEDSETDDDSDTEDESMEEAEPEDDSELTYDDHLGPVYCVNLDPKENNLAVTGGEFSRAYVWRLSDGETLFECKGHDGPIGFVAFSHDSSMVFTGDMKGLIKVWKVEDGKEIWSYEVPDLEVGAPKDEYEEQNVPYVLLLESRKQKLQWLEWHPRSHVLLYGTPDGNTWMWKIPGGECKTFQGPNCPATCGQFLPDGERAVVGYEDGSVWIWDLKQGNTVHVLKGSDGHKGPLSCLSSNSDGSFILTGGFDCDTKMVNTATGKVVAVFRTERDTVKASKYEDKFNSVESVGFCNVLPLVAVLYLDGFVAVFDISTQNERARCQHKSNIRRVLWDHYSPVLYTCCSDGVLRLWDSRSGEMISEYCGHTADIVDFALNKDSSIVVTASADREAKVFCVQRIDR